MLCISNVLNDLESSGSGMSFFFLFKKTDVKVGLHLNFAEKLVFRFSLKSATLTI